MMLNTFSRACLQSLDPRQSVHMLFHFLHRSVVHALLVLEEIGVVLFLIFDKIIMEPFRP